LNPLQQAILNGQTDEARRLASTDVALLHSVTEVGTSVLPLARRTTRRELPEEVDNHGLTRLPPECLDDLSFLAARCNGWLRWGGVSVSVTFVDAATGFDATRSGF
jgi:hypothetical protein